MLETAFTLLGTAVSWLELLAFVLALANIACNVAEIHWGWPLTIVASLLYAWLFYASKLYGEAGVNVFFAATGVWGWWQWLRGHRGDSGAPLRIARLDSRGLLWCISGFALAWLLLGLLLRGVTVSALASLQGAKAANADGSVELPASWQLDAGLSYAHSIAGQSVLWRANLENLTDRTYWREAPTTAWGGIYLFPSTPRTLRVSATLSF